MGRRLYFQVRERAPNKEQPTLDSDVEEHMRACPHCSDLGPLWIINAGGGIAASATKLLTDVKEGVGAVLHRSEGDLDVYFKPTKVGALDGLLVKVTRGGTIVSVDEANIEAFKRQ